MAWVPLGRWDEGSRRTHLDLIKDEHRSDLFTPFTDFFQPFNLSSPNTTFTLNRLHNHTTRLRRDQVVYMLIRHFVVFTDLDIGDEWCERSLILWIRSDGQRTH